MPGCTRWLQNVLGQHLAVNVEESKAPKPRDAGQFGRLASGATGGA